MAKYTGKGAQFQVRTAIGPDVWTAVAQVRRIGSISLTADEIEATTLDVGDFRQFIQGFKDAGELELEVIWDPALVSHNESTHGLWGMFTSGDNQTFRIVIPSDPVYHLTIDGFIRDFNLPEFNASDPLAVTAVVRLSSVPDLAAAA